MLRCFPRRTRHMWVLFLLVICLVGVYVTYKQLRDSENKRIKPYVSSGIDHKLDSLHRELYQKAQHNLHLPQEPDYNQGQGHIHVKQKGGNAAQNGRYAVRNLENENDYISSGEMSERLISLLSQLSPTNWQTAPDAGDMILRVKDLLSDLSIDSKLSCREIDALRLGSTGERAFYGKKSVDHALLDSRKEVVIKSLGTDQEFKINCMRVDYNPIRCESLTNYKILRELLYLIALDSPSIIKLKGYCVRGETAHPMINKKGAIIITESGRQISPSTLSNQPWRARLRMSYSVVQLVDYLENSPLGSLAFLKLHVTDFVLIGSQLRLVDLDNIQLGHKLCKTKKDCALDDMPRTEIACVKSRCLGRNSLKNLLMVYRVILDPLLREPIPSMAAEVKQFLMNIQNLKLDVHDVLRKLEEFMDRGVGDTAPEMGRDRPRAVTPRVRVQFPPAEEYVEESNDGDNDGDDPIHDAALAHRNVNGKVYNYTRHDRSNYPEYVMPRHRESKQDGHIYGLFDYHCDVSRVSWGCVISIHSLREATAICDQEEPCKSFVVFSANPEVDALMTMVMKNDAIGKPDPNYGATLFVKDQIHHQATVKPNGQPASSPGGVLRGGANTGALYVCLKRSQNQTEGARYSRERRLMAHLGLKGIRDNDWTSFARVVRITKHQGPSQLTIDGTHGGHYLVALNNNALGLTRATFMLEYGPLQHHIAYILSYFVDRVLGLYHVPPAVARKLSKLDFQAVQGDNSWADTFGRFTNAEDGGMLGVMSVPVPPVMKTNKLSIQSIDRVVSEVVPFSRDQKAQLEYILLLYLLKMNKPQHGYLGYKGHLIHFEVDLAFQNVKQVMLGYFYNCQFPNAVYKTLVCYKCPRMDKMIQICGFGEEVIKRTVQSGFPEEDVKVGTFSARDLWQIINNGASSILTVVDHCIKLFSREKVLY